MEATDDAPADGEVLGKGRTGRERLTLPAPTSAALGAWVERRGLEPGPLFVNFDLCGQGPAAHRHVGLSDRALSRQAGLTVRDRPSGISAHPAAVRTPLRVRR